MVMQSSPLHMKADMKKNYNIRLYFKKTAGSAAYMYIDFEINNI